MHVGGWVLEAWMWVAGPRLLIDVLGHPAKAFSIALPFQHTAHEHFQRPGVQLLQRHTALEERRAVRPGFHRIKVLLSALLQNKTWLLRIQVPWHVKLFLLYCDDVANEWERCELGTCKGIKQSPGCWRTPVFLVPGSPGLEDLKL